MAVRDLKLLPSSAVAIHRDTFAPVIATSQTGRRVAIFKPGYEFMLLAAQLYARAYTAAVNFLITVVNGDGIVGAVDATLAINATAEKFQTAAIEYVIGGVGYSKASTSGAGVTFSAAHVVSATKFGVILVQINAAGTISTKVSSATQAFDSLAEALLLLPSPDSGNISLGYIGIEADAGDWTANTDDLTPGSDLTAVTYSDTAPITPAMAAFAPVAGEVVESATPTKVLGHGNSDGLIVVQYTSDGTGAATDLLLTVRHRPYPLNGETSIVST